MNVYTIEYYAAVNENKNKEAPFGLSGKTTRIDNFIYIYS